MNIYFVFTYMQFINWDIYRTAARKSPTLKILANCWKTSNQRMLHIILIIWITSTYNDSCWTFVCRLNTEAKLAVIWGLLITCGSKLLEMNPNAREPLLLLARYLRVSSNVSDGWGEGILGAIGLKKETVSNKYDRFLACFLPIQRAINLYREFFPDWKWQPSAYPAWYSHHFWKSINIKSKPNA